MQPEYELPLASNDAARLAQLRGQTRPQRVPSATLTAALGAPTILPGREQEAYEIWRGLCARTADGDAAAGEDMVMLTLLLANELTSADKLAELRALSQEALQAARLPRHKQEQLGRLCRLAVREGDSVAAFEALSAMVVDPPDIESDSELRISAAAAATLVGSHQYVVSILGARAGDIPIDESLQPLAIVLRANALEQLGQLPAATLALRELPHFGIFTDLSATFSVLKLCPKSSANYDHMGDSVHRNVPAPLGTALPLGVLFIGFGCVIGGALLWSDDRGYPTGGNLIVTWLLMIFTFLLGVPLILGGISSRRRITFLRQRGIARRARVVQVEGTTSSIGKIPIYRLTLELMGRNGPYRAQVSKTLHAPEASSIVGQSLSILVNPNDDTDVILDETELV